MDAIICAWENQMDDPISALAEIDCAFYANDGKLGGWDAPCIQQSLDIFTRLFACMGLWMNAKKTQAMITKGRVETIQQSDAAYMCQMTGVGLTYHQRKAQPINCPVCNEGVQQRSLLNHIHFQHHDEYVDTFQDQLEPAVQEEPLDEGTYFCDMLTG